MTRAINKRLRFEVFKRDGFVCVYCGRHPPEVVLHCDHVVAVVDGGPDHEDNLVTACLDCNLGKGAVPLTVAPLTVAEKADLVREREEQLAAYNEALFARRDRREEEAWVVAGILMRAWREEEIRVTYFNSILRFVDLLPYAEVVDAAEVATMRKPWLGRGASFKYFCGVCWRKIRRDRGEVIEEDDVA